MLSATGIHKGFDGLGVLRGIDLNVEKGEVVALIGPSGSGKSTLLRCLNQLETVDSGTIILDDITLCRTRGGKLTYADPATLRRITLKMGMVFQSYNLFPHMSVMQNLTDAPMRVKRLSRAQATERRASCLPRSAFPTRRISTPTSCPAVSSSAWRSPAPCVWGRRFCALTSPPAPWTRS